MKRILFRVLTGLLFLVIISLALAPGAAKRYLEKHSPELIGRSVSLDKFKVNYLNWKFRLIGFNLYESDKQSTFVSFDTMLVDLKPLKLVRHELEVQQFYLSGLQTFVSRVDSAFNFSDLLAFHSSEDTLASDTLSRELFRYHLYNLELKDAMIEFENRNLEDTIYLRDISFTIPYVGWDQEEKSEAGLRFNLEKEGFLEAGININPVDGEIDASLILHRLYLESIQKYANSYADIGSLKGIFNTRMDLRGNIKEPDQSIISGTFELLDLHLEDQYDQKFLSADAIHMAIGEFDPFNSRFLIDSLILSAPYIYFELKDSSNNIFDILRITPTDTLSSKPDESKQDSLLETESSGIYYAIQSFRMEQGLIDIRDHSAGDPFDYNLSDIQINADSIESSAESVSIYAAMLLNKRGNLLSEIAFSPLNPGNFVLDYTISDFRLSDLNLYSRYYVGFPIVYGDMYYRGHTEVSNHQMLSENKLIMDRVELGERTQGLHDIPLKLALYILKDRHDVIELDIPVGGRTDDPQLKVGYIVWNTLKNRIFGVVEAPYDYLAGMVGADPKELEVIEFGYMDTSLTVGIKRQLDLLMELEQLKSELEIDLIYYNDQKEEQDMISKVNQDPVSTEIQQGDHPMISPEAIDSIAKTYSEARVSNIMDHLSTSPDSSHIKVIRSNVQDPLNKGSLPRFKVEYTMKSQSEGLDGEAKVEN